MNSVVRFVFGEEGFAFLRGRLAEGGALAERLCRARGPFVTSYAYLPKRSFHMAAHFDSAGVADYKASRASLMMDLMGRANAVRSLFVEDSWMLPSDTNIGDAALRLAWCGTVVHGGNIKSGGVERLNELFAGVVTYDTFLVACCCSLDEVLAAGDVSDEAALDAVCRGALLVAATAYDEDGFVIGEFGSVRDGAAVL